MDVLLANVDLYGNTVERLKSEFTVGDWEMRDVMVSKQYIPTMLSCTICRLRVVNLSYQPGPKFSH